MTIHPAHLASTFTGEDVAAIAADVWTCFVGDPDCLLPAASAGSTPLGVGREGYVATVGITGTWTGHVILELSPDAAERAARAMLATDRVSADDVSDALGELVNMVGGNIKGLVPQPSALGLPLVFEAAGAPAIGRDVASVCIADLDWLGEPLRISVWESARTSTEG